MAIFHFSLHDRVSRGAGQSSVASAAYIDREMYVDERTGEVFDYTRLRAPLFTGMYAPKDAPDWARDAQQFWNRVEAFEKRCDAQLAMPLDIALPHELTLEQNRYLVQDFVRENFVRKGYVAHVAIHPPDHDQRNIHAHVLVTLRTVGADGFAPTKGEQQENYRNRAEYTEKLRESWENLANRHLERHGHDARIDRRTLKEQGTAREATTHLGPTAAAAMFDRADRRELQAAEAELKAISAEIVDLAAERAKREAREAAEDLADDRRPAAALGKTAGDIRLAWSLTQGGADFAAALEERGIRLARVTAEEAGESERKEAFAEEVGRFAGRLGEDEIVAVNDHGYVYRIDRRTTGALRAEIDKRIGGIDPASVASVTETRETVREEARAAWIAQKDRERPLTPMEERVAGAFVAMQGVAADMLERFGRALTGEEFAEGLVQAGARLARVTEEDAKRIEIDRAVAFAVGDGEFLPRVREGDLVAIDRAGGIHSLNPHRIDLGGVEQALGDENLPSVGEARGASAAESRDAPEQGADRSSGSRDGPAESGAAHDSDMREAHDIVGRAAEGAFKVFAGLAEFLFPTKREPRKPDPEGDYQRWVQAENAKRASDASLHQSPSQDPYTVNPNEGEDVEESQGDSYGQSNGLDPTPRRVRRRRRAR